MGLFDRLQDGVNRGIGETERLLEVGKLKSSLSSITKERDNLLLSLGRAAYELHRRGERELGSLGDACERVRQLELEMAQLESRIDELSRPKSPTGPVCSGCGAPAPVGAAFCVGCGKPLEIVKKPVCAQCGAELPDQGQFCVRCGSSRIDDAEPREEGVSG